MKIVRPQIYPDEHGPGYMGRLMRFNGVSKEGDFTSMLLQWAGRPGASLRAVPMVELLAAAAGMEMPAFVQHHSLLPLRRAIAKSDWDRPHGSQDLPGLLWTLTFRKYRPGAYLCDRCVSEDVEFHGAAYWRREHQLPGQYWCVKHACPLSGTAMARGFLLSPARAVEHARPEEDRWTQSLLRCPAIERFLAIAAEFLYRPQPLDEAALMRGLRGLAMQRGFHVGVGELRGELLSDCLLETFDRRWLSVAVRSFDRKRSKEYFPPIDLATSGSQTGLSPTVYIAAFAALFDDPDEAFAAMVRLGTAVEEAPSRGPAALGNPDIARRTYVQQRGNYLGIARSLGVDRLTVARHLERYGLPALGKQSVEQLARLLQRFGRDGLSLDWACDGDSDTKALLESLLRTTSQHLLEALEAIQQVDERKRRRRKGRRQGESGEDSSTALRGGDRATRRAGNSNARPGRAETETSTSSSGSESTA